MVVNVLIKERVELVRNVLVEMRWRWKKENNREKKKTMDLWLGFSRHSAICDKGTAEPSQNTLWSSSRGV